MNFKNFITCSNPLCARELKPTLEYEKGEAMVSNYHCEQCCYSFSIYSITKTKLAEIQGISPTKAKIEILADEFENNLSNQSMFEEVMEQHEMEDK